MKKALIVVDLQNDFCPGGALPVAGGDQVVPVANKLIHFFESNNWPIYFTRDWHPANHSSFQENGGIWPVHCVAETDGAAFHAALNIPTQATIISTATQAEYEAYSGFERTNLAKLLKQQKVSELVVVGLATDYCVKHTVLDGLKAGFKVSVVQEGVRAVNVKPGDGDQALEEMEKNGAKVVNLGEVIG